MASRRTQRASVSKPWKKTIKFNASIGEFEYWDNEAKENITLEELTITPLVTKGRLSGYHNSYKSQILSNYIEDSKQEEFKAIYFRSGKATNVPELTGLWEDIKASASSAQINFTQSIIGLAVINGVEEIVELIVYRSSLSSWIEIANKTAENVMASQLVLTKGRLLRKGADKEPIPVTKKEQEDMEKKLKKNPRATVPITYYEIVASEVTPLDDKGLKYTDDKITLVEDYFDAQSSSRSERASRDERSASNAPEQEGDEDDLPF